MNKEEFIEIVKHNIEVDEASFCMDILCEDCFIKGKSCSGYPSIGMEVKNRNEKIKEFLNIENNLEQW